MRGLTNEEREFLTAQPGGPLFSSLRNLLPLVKRGLVRYDHHGDHATYELTAGAALALRLDAAARAVCGVSA